MDLLLSYTKSDQCFPFYKYNDVSDNKSGLWPEADYHKWEYKWYSNNRFMCEIHNIPVGFLYNCTKLGVDIYTLLISPPTSIARMFSESDMRILVSLYQLVGNLLDVKYNLKNKNAHINTVCNKIYECIMSWLTKSNYTTIKCRGYRINIDGSIKVYTVVVDTSSRPFTVKMGPMTWDIQRLNYRAQHVDDDIWLIDWEYLITRAGLHFFPSVINTMIHNFV